MEVRKMLKKIIISWSVLLPTVGCSSFTDIYGLQEVIFVTTTENVIQLTNWAIVWLVLENEHDLSHKASLLWVNEFWAWQGLFFLPFLREVTKWLPVNNKCQLGVVRWIEQTVTQFILRNLSLSNQLTIYSYIFYFTHNSYFLLLSHKHFVTSIF